MLRRPTATISAVTFATVGLALAVASGPSTTQAGGGCHVESGDGYSEGTATVVRMEACSFEPTVVRVPVGTTVRFLNTAPNDHAVAGRRNLWGSDDILVPGAQFSERFTAAGVYPYTCPLHPGMVGAVMVGDAGAAAAPVTDVGAGTAPPPAPVRDATSAQTGSASIVPAAVGAAGGGIIGLLVGLAVSRRRPTATSADSIRTTPALDG